MSSQDWIPFFSCSSPARDRPVLSHGQPSILRATWKVCEMLYHLASMSFTHSKLESSILAASQVTSLTPRGLSLRRTGTCIGRVRDGVIGLDHEKTQFIIRQSISMIHGVMFRALVMLDTRSLLLSNTCVPQGSQVQHLNTYECRNILRKLRPTTMTTSFYHVSSRLIDIGETRSIAIHLA